MNGLLDFYAVGPLLDNTANRYQAKDFVLRDKLGGGNFGRWRSTLRLLVSGALSAILSGERR